MRAHVRDALLVAVHGRFVRETLGASGKFEAVPLAAALGALCLVNIHWFGTRFALAEAVCEYSEEREVSEPDACVLL